jgi:hypothetical protein
MRFRSLLLYFALAAPSAFAEIPAPSLVAELVPQPATVSDVIAADFDGDGRLDIGYSAGGTDVDFRMQTWREGSGFVDIGRFGMAISSSVGQFTRVLNGGVVGGRVRLVVANLGIVSVFEGWPPRMVRSFPVSVFTRSFTTADANGDGQYELFIVQDGSLRSFDLANGNERWSVPASVPSDATIKAGRIDGDAALEIVVSGPTTRIVDDFTRADEAVPAIDSRGGTAILDLDGDGRDELLVASTVGTAVYGGTPLQLRTNWNFNAIVSPQLAQLDGTGPLELFVTRGRSSLLVTTTAYEVATGTELRDVGPQVSNAFRIGDFDGDGIAEVLSFSRFPPFGNGAQNLRLDLRDLTADTSQWSRDGEGGPFRLARRAGEAAAPGDLVLASSDRIDNAGDTLRRISPELRTVRSLRPSVRSEFVVQVPRADGTSIEAVTASGSTIAGYDTAAGQRWEQALPGAVKSLDVVAVDGDSVPDTVALSRSGASTETLAVTIRSGETAASIAQFEVALRPDDLDATSIVDTDDDGDGDLVLLASGRVLSVDLRQRTTRQLLLVPDSSVPFTAPSLAWLPVGLGGGGEWASWGPTSSLSIYDAVTGARSRTLSSEGLLAAVREVPGRPDRLLYAARGQLYLRSARSGAMITASTYVSSGLGGGNDLRVLSTAADGSVEVIAPSDDGVHRMRVPLDPLPAVELDQFGVGGAWFEPENSGQGFALEVFPDLIAPGRGLVSGGWFTFATTPGGADRQRWFTVAGELTAGQRLAELTIYRNIGGSFDAPPVTTARTWGTAWFSLESCDAARLEYQIGSARGSIALRRLLGNATCGTLGSTTTDVDYALSGNWFQPATSGQGLIVENNPAAGQFFLTWYTYAGNTATQSESAQRWYTGQAASTRGQRRFDTAIYETVGGTLDEPPGSTQRTQVVGQGSFDFLDCTHARFAYSITSGANAGRSNTIELSRVGPAPPDCR